MIKTSRQLKDKIRNLAKEKSADAQILMRTYMMERFLERISLSEYKNNFVLKGGVLIASLVGLDSRSTMDLDTTLKGVDVNLTNAEQMMEQLIALPLEDGVVFQIKSIDTIMNEAEYPGIRISMQALFDSTRTPIKVDLSTGDAITPGAIQYFYPLMFEDRSIPLLSYNLETVLAEKLETIIRRHVTNTRIRDFYDVYILSKLYQSKISKQVLKNALKETAKMRESTRILEHGQLALSEIENSNILKKYWISYQSHYKYAQNISWDDVMEVVKELFAESL